MVAVKTELEYEQAYVSILYQRLDTLRVRAAERVAQVLGRAEFGGTYQGRLERDALVTRYRDRLAQLWSAETGLCCGRRVRSTGPRPPTPPGWSGAGTCGPRAASWSTSRTTCWTSTR